MSIIRHSSIIDMCNATTPRVETPKTGGTRSLMSKDIERNRHNGVCQATSEMSAFERKETDLTVNSQS